MGQSCEPREIKMIRACMVMSALYPTTFSPSDARAFIALNAASR